MRIPLIKMCLEKEEVVVEELLMQNHSKSKITERLSLPELKDEILQVCHSSADLQIEKWKCRMEEFWQRGF